MRGRVVKLTQCRAGLDGRLLGAPELQGIECFSGAESGLKPVAVDAWGPLVFVNMTAGASDAGALLLAMQSCGRHIGER